MSEAKTHASSRQGLLDAPAATSEFSELWRNVSNKFSHSKNKKAKPAAGSASPLFTDLQSPTRRCRFPGLNNADSPGDVEPSQDIIWDSTSPTHTNSGFRCTKVEISDLVNRIAPKDVKALRPDSSLLQWIGDSAVPCTPDIPKQRTRKRSSRQNSVEDLMKLARKFDENMQQDKDTCEKLNIVNNNINKQHVDPADPKLTEANVTENVKHHNPEEAELHALFDSSTQKVSGRLSQGSTASTCSQEVKLQPKTSSSLKPTRGEKTKPYINSNKCDDFDDDWENDDLLNDSLLLAITPEQHSATTKTITQSNTSQCISDGKPSGNVPKMSRVHSKPSYSALQALCPKPKTTNRSTFRLGPNPVGQPTSGFPKESPASKFTALKSSNQTEQWPAVSMKTISDSSWDDGDDALLYQVCDSVERISNSQPHKVNKSESDCQNKPDRAVNRLQTAPVPIKPSRSTNSSASANKQSCAFVRANSLPETSSNSLNFQGWNNPMKGSSDKPQTSQSLPGSHASSFSQMKYSLASLQHYNQDLNIAKSQQNSNHSAFKRNVSDSAVICNKVFVTSQMAGKCSAAEIEKKKQEALARRRQRMQYTPKP